MALSVFGMQQLLEKLKDLKKIKKAKFDGKPVDILDSSVNVGPTACEISCQFKHDGSEHTIKAYHPWKEDEDSNVVTLNGQDVDHDDVDLDADWHLGSVKMEYKLQYKQNGTPHELVLTAKSGLM